MKPQQPPLFPPPNKDWTYSPPVQSADGKVVWVDAMVLPMIVEHYRIAGIKPVPAKG